MAKPRGRNSPDRRAVSLNRALSKLGALSRSEATRAIVAGRVRVNGSVTIRPDHRVVPGSARISLDGRALRRPPSRTILFHKPLGVLTTSRDPEGRRTIFDVLGETGHGLVAVGRLDAATSGLLLLTNDTRLADWITNPDNEVVRLYVVTVRGRVDEGGIRQLTSGIEDRHERLRAHAVTLRKSSSRESHLLVELREGKNREVRRLFAAIGHEVARLKRVKLGGLELGSLRAGEWRTISPDELMVAFPGARIR